MDWDGVIERNTEALKRILAMLVAMAGLPVGPHPEVRAEGEPRRTLPRHVHRAVLRLLRPLEAATRRLVVVVARGLPAPALPPREPIAAPSMALPTGTRIVRLRNLGLAGHDVAPPRPAPRTWSLPMADPLKRFGPRRRTVPPHRAPRILSFDGVAPHRLPPPPSADDPIDSTRLGMRLAGIGRALADLPREARRFARWKAASDAASAQTRETPGIIRRVSPLRPGRAPGWRKRPTHQVHEVLADLQFFAREALVRPRPTSPDTS